MELIRYFVSGVLIIVLGLALYSVNISLFLKKDSTMTKTTTLPIVAGNITIQTTSTQTIKTTQETPPRKNLLNMLYSIKMNVTESVLMSLLVFIISSCDREIRPVAYFIN